jgi:NADH-quinone oxidoreductase subunit J
MIATILFGIFAALLLAGAWAVVLARNPMVAVLGMIFAFVNAAGLFILMQAEFLGLLLIMVYVGAIAVMFLFVLMTIDIDFAQLKEGMAPYLPAGLLTVLLLFGLLGAAVVQGGLPEATGTPLVNGEIENTRALGQVLFTNYALPFQMAGLVLLTAMVGAIVLTHRRRSGVRRQDIQMQVFRKREDAMVKTTPKLGAGAKVTHWNPQPFSKEQKTKVTKKGAKK